MDEHIPYIRQCQSLATDAVANGNHPFGALLIVDGVVVGTARNEAVTSGDPTRHAELNLLATAMASLTAEQRARAVLYTSTEPCIMCAGAIYWCGIGSVVYGCSS